MVWTSPVIAKLTSKDVNVNPLGAPATSYEISIIAGLPFFGSVFGSILLGQVCDIIGRRSVLTIIAAVNFVAYLILAFTGSVYCYFFSRFVLGVCQGVSAVVLPIFISEITEKHNRGRFGCLMSLFVVTGSFYGFAVGPFFSIRIFTLMCAIPMIVCVIMMILVVPESPYYLVSKKENIKALAALERLRNRLDVADDYLEIEKTLRSKSDIQYNAFMALLQDPVSRKAFLMNVVIIFFQVMSGSTVILAFVGPLFDSTNSGLSGNVVAILVGLAKVITYFLTSTIIEIAGRKRLLLMSSIGSGIVHGCLGFFFFARDNDYTFVQHLAWLPVVLVISYISLYSFGLGPVPSILLSEIQPSETKSLAASLVIGFGHVTAFGITTGFPLLTELLGHSTCFWTFAICCIAGATYFQFFLMETKGKTFLEIQEMLRTMV